MGLTSVDNIPINEKGQVFNNPNLFDDSQSYPDAFSEPEGTKGQKQSLNIAPESKEVQVPLAYYDKKTGKYVSAGYPDVYDGYHLNRDELILIPKAEIDSEEKLREKRKGSFREMKALNPIFTRLGNDELEEVQREDNGFDNMAVAIFRKVLELQGIDINSEVALHYLQAWMTIRNLKKNEKQKLRDGWTEDNEAYWRVMELAAIAHDLGKNTNNPAWLVNHAHESAEMIPNFLKNVFTEYFEQNNIDTANLSFDNLFEYISILAEAHSAIPYIQGAIDNPLGFVGKGGILEEGATISPMVSEDGKPRLVDPKDYKDPITAKMADILRAIDNFTNYGLLGRIEIDETLVNKLVFFGKDQQKEKDVFMANLQIAGFVKIVMLNLGNDHTLGESLIGLLNVIKKSMGIFENIESLKNRVSIITEKLGQFILSLETNSSTKTQLGKKLGEQLNDIPGNLDKAYIFDLIKSFSELILIK